MCLLCHHCHHIEAHQHDTPITREPDGRYGLQPRHTPQPTTPAPTTNTTRSATPEDVNQPLRL
jgi:hypothetical protein